LKVLSIVLIGEPILTHLEQACNGRRRFAPLSLEIDPQSWSQVSVYIGRKTWQIPKTLVMMSHDLISGLAVVLVSLMDLSRTAVDATTWVAFENSTQTLWRPPLVISSRRHRAQPLDPPGF
jgi:hypothetical protein